MAKVVIDATGDADILARAGVPCVNGKNYLSYIAFEADTDTVKKAAESEDMLKLRKWLTVGSDLWGKGHPEGSPMLTGVTAEEVTRFVLDGRSMLFKKIKDDNRRTRDITALPYMAQFRTTRRIQGDYTLTEEDEGKYFIDSIAVAGDFSKPGKRYELPYRLLYNSEFGNIFTAGRSISASGWAWDVVRVIPVAAATGQAAGTAAAILIKQDILANEIDISELQQCLIKSGARIHLE